MNKKNKTLMDDLLPVAIILILIFIGISGMKGLTARTSEALGEASEDLKGWRKLRTLYRCSLELDEITSVYISSDGSHPFDISAEDNASDVAAALEEANLIIDAQCFNDYLVYSGLDRKLQPGNYVLSAAMTIPQITKRITANEGKLVKFAFLTAMRLEEIAELVDAAGFAFSGEDFLQAATHYSPALHPTGGTSLEGYLLPGSYEMNRDISLNDFLGGFVGVFNQQVKPLEKEFAAHGLTLEQGVILASMIAREAMSPEEYARVASVFYNRYASGIKFASDPTVQYALGYDFENETWWKNPLSAEDLKTESLYNTYIAEGFPPAPICSPDFAVLKAAANPELTSYYYFRLRCDGSALHNFSVTFEEHEANACE